MTYDFPSLPAAIGGAMNTEAAKEPESPMSLRVAFQMDPIEAIDINADSTFRIALEAQKRGYRLFYYTPELLSYKDGRVIARGHEMTLRRVRGNHVDLGFETETDLSEWDVIWLRQDPPFDMGYITTTHLLDLLKPSSLVVNDPFWVRNYPEKLLVLQFPELIPPTIISRSLSVLEEFKNIHRDIIVKPLYGNGGLGVFRLGPDDQNLSSLHEFFVNMSREPLIGQKFLPSVEAGDKRIILVDGNPVGAINRLPQPGEIRSNMHVGGKAVKADLTDREKHICAAIGPTLREKGQIFVGIDVIGGYLTEINVTSPTGIQELERFDETNVADMIWTAIEARLA